MSHSVWPHRWQPTRFPCPWDSPGKNTGMGCHCLLKCMKVKVKSLSHVRPWATPRTVAHQAPPSMGFFRQEYWSGVPLPSHIYICMYVSVRYLFFSFWLNSLCITGFRFIYLIRADSNVFFYGQVIFHCMYVPQLLYPFICQWTSGLLPSYFQ